MDSEEKNTRKLLILIYLLISYYVFTTFANQHFLSFLHIRDQEFFYIHSSITRLSELLLWTTKTFSRNKCNNTNLIYNLLFQYEKKHIFIILLVPDAQCHYNAVFQRQSNRMKFDRIIDGHLSLRNSFCSSFLSLVKTTTVVSI